MNIKDLFVPYGLALKLKEKGFDEPCFGAWWSKEDISWADEFDRALYITQKDIDNRNDEDMVLAPLYQQVIDWLDSKNIHIQIIPEFYKDGINWNVQVFEYDSKATSFMTDRSTAMFGDNGEYTTRNEAILKGIEEALKLI